MARRTLTGTRALVTGASSGIGQALAIELARHGCNLILTARRLDRLETLASNIRGLGRAAELVSGDITEAEVREACLETARQQGGLDLLVNNAGIGAIGPFMDADEARLRRVMEVNFFAPAELMRAAVPLLRKAERPMIVNVSSVLAHRAVPSKSEYCASKFALHGLSDAFRAELQKDQIDLLLCSPSTTDTEFFDNVIEDRGQLPWRKWGAMSPEKVARKTVKAIRQGRQEIILTPGGKALVWLDRLCPPLVNRLVAKFGS